jgi:hypothetical protein
MTTSLWPYAITDEWKAAGVNFQDFFTNATMSARNGLKTVGSPVVSDGLRLDGSTQYGYYDTPRFHAAAGFTIELKFYPGFDFNDGLFHFLFDGSPNTLQFTLIKRNTNTLQLILANTAIFDSNAFAPYWLADQENSLIISATSGDTTVYLNNNKVIDSDATAFGNFSITRLWLGAGFGGAFKFSGTIKSFRFFMNAFTDADCEKLYDGRLLSELDPEKATLFAGLRSSYTNGAGEKVTPVLINGETQEMLFGSDGKTAGEYPDEISPRGWQFNGTAFGNAGDIDFTFSTVGGGDEKLSICFDYQPGDITTADGIIAKATSPSVGEYTIYQVAGVIRAFFIDQDNSGYIYRASSGLVKGKLERWVITKDDGTVPTGINIYRDGELDNAGVATVGTYVQMRNTTNPLWIGKYGTAIISAGSTMRLIHIPKIGVELSPAQARMWTARAKRLKNV